MIQASYRMELDKPNEMLSPYYAAEFEGRATIPGDVGFIRMDVYGLTMAGELCYLASFDGPTRTHCKLSFNLWFAGECCSRKLPLNYNGN